MDVDGMKAYAEELSQQLQRLTQDSHSMAAKMKAIVGKATSPDRFVSAKVDAKGSLIELELDPRIYRNEDSAALARLITETIQRAGTDATNQTKDVLSPYMSKEDVEANVSGDFDTIMRRFEDKLAFEGGHQ